MNLIYIDIEALSIQQCWSFKSGGNPALSF